MKSENGIYALICKIAAKFPDKNAVIYQDNTATYSELIALAQTLSMQLVKKGIAPGDTVAIYMNPSIDRVAAMLAIVSIGATYVPLDPIQPVERRNYICSNAKVSCILVDEINSSTPHGRAILINELKIADMTYVERTNKDYLDNVCYIMYTSGTTGKPKGVCITQKNVVSLAANRYCVQINESHVFAHASNFSFDPSTLEVWVPLLNGATIVVLDRDLMTRPYELYQNIKKYGIDALWLTSPLFNYLFTNGWSDFRCLDYLILGGESLSVKNMGQLANSPLRPKHIINAFGPTETTVFSLYYEIKNVDFGSKSIPIGKPLDNEYIYILDENEQEVPQGSSGELYIAGEGVGKGYLEADLNQKTAFKYIHINDKQIFSYKTGDIVKCDENGVYHFLGRIDDQIKINGFRVEPNEILNCIEQHPSVEKALIRDFPDKDNNHRLVAYVLKKKNAALQIDSWRRVYDDVYKMSQQQEMLENFSGWRDSISQKDFSKAEMHNWLNSAVENIKLLSPKNVFEIGCGTGLLLFKLWDTFANYTAIDISKESIDYIKNTMKNNHMDASRVNLFHCEANEVSQFIDESVKFDLIIMNSVIQYFPNIEHFENVLSQLVPLLTKNGCIYIGDIRNYALLELFYSRKYKNKHSLNNAAQLENELCISPYYFYTIEQRLKNIKCKMVKQRIFNNPVELSVYRYDAILSVAEPVSDITQEVQIIDCLTTKLAKESILNSPANTILFKNISNTDVLSEFSKIEDDEYLKSVPLSGKPSFICNPREVVTWFNHKFSTVIPLCHPTQNKLFDVLLSKEKLDIRNFNLPFQNLTKDDSSYHFNKIKSTEYTLEESDLFKSIANKLPHYMLPKRIIITPSLTVNINGKYEFSSLVNPFLNVVDSNIQPPTYMDRLTLFDMIQKFLDGRAIQLDEETNLILIGLDSLNFLSLIAMIEENYGVRLSLSQLLENPVVKIIQQKIDKQIKTLEVDKPAVESYQSNTIPLLPNQIEKYYEHMDEKLKYVNNIVYRIDYNKDFNFDKLNQSLQNLYAKHAVLRVNVHTEGNKFYQIIGETNQCQIEHHISTTEGFNEAVADITNKLQWQNISLETGYLFQCVIIQCENNATLLIYFHHILLDLQSIDRIVENLNTLYLAMNDPKLDSDIDSYKSFVFKQEKHIFSNQYKNNIRQIAEEMKGKPRELIVKNHNTNDTSGDYVSTPIPFGYVNRVHQKAKELQVTPFTLYLCAFQLAIHCIFNQEDFIVGITSSTRYSQDTNNIIGLINNYLLVPFNSVGDTIEQKILTTHKNLLTAFDLIEYNNYDIYKEILSSGDKNKLFNLFFDYKKNQIKDIQPHTDKSVSVIGLQPSRIVNRILSFRVTESPTDAKLTVRYRSSIFDNNFIHDLSLAYIQTLADLLKTKTEICYAD